MQDLNEISNCAQRIDSLLNTPTASVSAQLRRSISPALSSLTSASPSRRQSGAGEEEDDKEDEEAEEERCLVDSDVD